MTRIGEGRLRNTRAWAQARLDSLSGARVIVSAIDELLVLRAYRKEGCVAVQRKDIEHLLEYWNGSENERAMSDALKYILGALEGLLAAAPEPQEE